MHASVACRLAPRVAVALRSAPRSSPTSLPRGFAPPSPTTTTTMSASSRSIRPRRYIDVGANLTDGMFRGEYHGKTYEPDLDVVLRRAWDVGVEKVMVTAGTLPEARDAIDLADNSTGAIQTVSTPKTPNDDRARGVCSRRSGCIRRDATSSRRPATATCTSNPSSRSRSRARGRAGWWPGWRVQAGLRQAAVLRRGFAAQMVRGAVRNTRAGSAHVPACACRGGLHGDRPAQPRRV